jgi:oligosaccharyltransferase complex subunit delta (ribophorin II)
LLTRALQSHKDLPVQLLAATKPLKASVVLASFGSAQGLNTPVFEVKIETDANVPPAAYEKPLRYGKKPEIHHIFRPDPTSPNKVISLVFALAVAAALPALLIGVSYPSGRLAPSQ